LLYKKLIEIQKLNWSKISKNIAQNAGFCIKILKMFIGGGGKGIYFLRGYSRNPSIKAAGNP
jgi:hypothetical protein